PGDLLARGAAVGAPGGGHGGGVRGRRVVQRVPGAARLPHARVELHHEPRAVVLPGPLRHPAALPGADGAGGAAAGGDRVLRRAGGAAARPRHDGRAGVTRRDPATAAKRRARALPPGSLLEGLAPHLRRTVRVAGEPLVLRVLLNEPEAPAPLYPRPLYRTQAHLFALALGPHDSGSADLHTGFAFAVVSPALLADRWRLQRQLLATLGLALLGVARGHVPLHCAALTRDGRSVLVHGPSGTGKSTLAYAAARRGYQVVSEDAVHVSGARE